MGSASDLLEYDAVQAWVRGLKEQWGEEPSDMAQRIETLRGFCELMQNDPDSLVRECSREVEGGKRIRVKVRRLYDEKIGEFQASNGTDRWAQARLGNTIRSFFIHNGIFMQGGLG